MYVGTSAWLRCACRASYTTSLATNITDYKIENGRRYHAYKEGSRSPFTSVAKDIVDSKWLRLSLSER